MGKLLKFKPRQAKPVESVPVPGTAEQLDPVEFAKRIKAAFSDEELAEIAKDLDRMGMGDS